MKRDFALAAEYPQRVGMIIDRDNPPRLVHRFGYIMPERTLSLDADRYGSVLWDDGEFDLVEWERLRPLSDMGHNPHGYAIVNLADEVEIFDTARGAKIGDASVDQHQGCGSCLRSSCRMGEASEPSLRVHRC
jgi:hypothetical protein